MCASVGTTGCASRGCGDFVAAHTCVEVALLFRDVFASEVGLFGVRCPPGTKGHHRCCDAERVEGSSSWSEVRT